MRHPSPEPPPPGLGEEATREEGEVSKSGDGDNTLASSKEVGARTLKAGLGGKEADKPETTNVSDEDGSMSSSKSDEDGVRAKKQRTNKPNSGLGAEQEENNEDEEDDDRGSRSLRRSNESVDNVGPRSGVRGKEATEEDADGPRSVEGSDIPVEEDNVNDEDDSSGWRETETQDGEQGDSSEDEIGERVKDRTVHEIVSTLHKRGHAEPMPSTVARNLERRRKRLREAQGLGTPPPEEEALSAPVAGNPEPSATPCAPQVRLDADGNIVVDHSSLVVDAGNNGANDGASMAVVEHGERTHVTSATFSKWERGIRWRPEETEYFYHCLAVFGTDFSVMERAFRTRNRRQLKLKFKKEERCNSDRIDAALAKPTDASEAARLLANPQLDDPVVAAAAALANGNTESDPTPVDTPQT